jgi:hypothetical protein
MFYKIQLKKMRIQSNSTDSHSISLPNFYSFMFRPVHFITFNQIKGFIKGLEVG